MAELNPTGTDVFNCVVCGMGSHRKDWVNKYEVNGAIAVACDNHPEDVIQKAIEAKVKAANEAKVAASKAAAAA